MDAVTPPSVLTVAALEAQHLARPITVVVRGRDGKTREDTRYEISDEGRRLLAENQRALAAYYSEHPDEARARTIAIIRAGKRSA